MINLLVKRFVLKGADKSGIHVRQRYGMLCGILGIICNVVLFLIKIKKRNIYP